MSSPPSPVRLPAGVRDFLPRAAARRRAIAERVLGELEAWGYTRLVTPVFECADVLERGLGADARAAALRFVEPGSGEVVALRPDFTPQVARIAATRLADVDGPLRLCYEGAVNRLTSPTRGPLAQREILQAGIELIGAGGPDADAEALAVASATLAHLGVVAAPLDVGHVAPARWVLASIPEPARTALASALGKKYRREVARAAAAGGAEAGHADIAALAEALVGLTGPAADVLARARALPWPHDVAAALDELGTALDRAAQLQPGATFTVDLGEVRGFEYYTGLRFAGYARGAGDAVLRGGRYDELVGRYGRAARAVGFAVDIEAIAQAQRAAGLAPPAPPPGALIVATAADAARAAAVAAALRAAGVRAALELAAVERAGGNAAGRVRYAVETGWTHVLDLAAATVHAVADGAAPAPIPVTAITAAADGDGAALATILAVRRP